MQNVFESLPPAPLADLLLRGVCSRCILRFFNVRDTGLRHCISNSSELFFQLRPVLVRVMGEERLNGIQEKVNLEQVSKACKPDGGLPSQTMPRICIVCLGILQLYLQDNVHSADDTDTRKSPVISEVTKTVQKEGHKFDSFCLEISIPALTFVREHALWCYLNSRYSSEGLFKGADVNERIVPLKESLKHLLVRPLEQLWNASFDPNSTFRVALFYKHTNSSAELSFLDGLQGSCSKLGCQGKSKCNNVSKATIGATRENLEYGESLSFVQRSLPSIPLHKFSDHFPWPPPKLDAPCTMTTRCFCRALYVGGRYLKFSRNISQSPWMIDDERKGKSSVQEIIGEKVLLLFKADGYKFHAAGREDIDVRMLGNGRPFLLEITNARVIPTQSELTQVEASLNIIKGEWRGRAGKSEGP
ncbi:hypothetical protein O6H91_03G024600 [Diphasiastrum complanatum]|uniref:Uncharacterized protein n=1 Tax=Diphasiastrum complanatum TaxID=34168 RepID=A0ACC2E4E2_DIPCM|nr:hypothetical protein O6H91_03G024600 [Diphasiastrum complanatum]